MGRKKKELLNEDLIQEFDAMDVVALRKAVADAEQNIVTATEERNANPNYIEAKDVCKTLNSGLADVRKYQGAKITYALKRLKEQGEVD